MGIFDLLHDLYLLFLDNLGPLAMACCLIAGVALGVWFWLRSGSRKEKNREVGTYAEALKDTTQALKANGQLLQATQKQLVEVHQKNLDLHTALSGALVELDQARRALDAAKSDIRDLNTALQTERSDNTTTAVTLNHQIDRLQTRVDDLQLQVTTNQIQHSEEVERLKTLLQISENARLRAVDELKCVQRELAEIKARLEPEQATAPDFSGDTQLPASTDEQTGAQSESDNLKKEFKSDEQPVL